MVVDLGELFTSVQCDHALPLILLGAWENIEWVYVAGCT